MAKKKRTTKRPRTIKPKPVEIRIPGKKKPTKKKKPAKQNKESTDVTALITQGANVGKLIQSKDRDNLAQWFNVYMAVEVEPGSNTHRAKLGDIEWFLRFFFESTSGYDCDQWTKSLSKSFKTWIQKTKSQKTGKKLAPNSCRRILDTVRRAAKWIHRQRPFLAGFPFDGVKSISVGEPDWQGLSDLEVRRLKAAAEQLIQSETRADQVPRRNYALLRVFLDSGLRAFEICELEIDQYQEGCLRRIVRKGRDNSTEEIPLSSDTCEALDDYIDSERPDGDGPLFQSRNGNAIYQQNLDQVVRRIAAHANSKLSKKDHIKISPHVLRHTSLRKWAEHEDVRYAKKISGHASDKYIWLYTQPSKEEVRKKVEDVWD